MDEISFDDLARRWCLCRLSVARFFSRPKSDQSESIGENSQDEIALVRQVDPEKWEIALKEVYDSSRRLALSASKYFKIRFEVGDFPKLFKIASVPCATGSWDDRGSAFTSRRTDCGFGPSREVAICDWFREAMDGIVMGLGESERFVRHASQAYGDPDCVDVVFDDSPVVAGGFQYAPVPAPFTSHLKKVVTNFGEQGFKVDWLGYRSGVLFYTLIPEKSDRPLCQSKGRKAHMELEAAVKGVFPTVRIQDSSPLAVYGEGTK